MRLLEAGPIYLVHNTPYLSPELAWPPQVRSDCVYKWERTVMEISVHTAGTEMATTPYR